MMAQGYLPPGPRLRHGSKTSMKCSVEEILAAFTSLDVSSLEEEALYNFLKLFPTNDQMGRFGDCAMDPKLSRTVVELYVKMIQMPFVDKILEIALFKLPFSDRVSQLSKDLLLLSQVCRDAKRSAKLRRILGMIPTSHVHDVSPSHPPAPPPAPSFSNPMFQVLPDRGNRSKLWPPSPPLPPTPPPSPSPSHSNLQHYHRHHVAIADAAAAATEGKEDAKQQTKNAAPRPPTPPPLPAPLRAHFVWKTQYVEASERCTHYTWKAQDNMDRQSTAPEVNQSCDIDLKQGCSSLPTPPPPPPPPSWISWTPKCASYERVARRHEVKELEVIAKELKKTEEGIHASRIEYGYAKLRAAGNKESSVMLELCRNLSRESADLMQFSIDSEIPCLRDAVGFEVKSWRYRQKELLQLRTEFDKAIVLWKTSIRKCVETKSTQEMMDAFFSKGEQDLQDLSNFLREVESSTGNLLYHLEADKHRRRQGYLDEDEPIVAIFLNFVECFKTTAAEIELEKQRALQLPKVNLLDSIFSSDDPKMDANHLKNLLSFCPSKKQLDMFKNLVKDEGSAVSAQDKLSALLSTPNIQGKLKLLCIKKNLPAQAQKLRFQLTNLIQAAKEIVLSADLNRVMGVIALLRPTRGSSSAARSKSPVASDKCAVADGEDQSEQEGEVTESDYSEITTSRGISLNLLYQLRSKTVLDLVKYIEEKYPELLEFHKTLPHLESGTQTAENLLAIADEIRSLLRNIEDLESELKHLQTEAESCARTEGASTLSLWMSFLLDAEAEYQSVLRVWRDARHSINELVDFFHENRVHFPIQDGISAILSFVKKFQQAAQTLASEVNKASPLQQLQVEGERTAGGLDADRDHGLKDEETRLEQAQADEKEKPFPQIHSMFAV